MLTGLMIIFPLLVLNQLEMMIHIFVSYIYLMLFIFILQLEKIIRDVIETNCIGKISIRK